MARAGLLGKLDVVAAKLDAIPNLNRGGCGAAAWAIAAALRKLGVMADITNTKCGYGVSLADAVADILDEGEDPTPWTVEELSDMRPVYFPHVVCIFTWNSRMYGVDSKGVHHISKWGRNPFSCNTQPFSDEGAHPDLVARAMWDGAGWNPTFDRDYLQHILCAVSHLGVTVTPPCLEYA